MNSTSAALRIALVGNPNSGKTALFNRLTGSRQKVANYAGVTVERKEGRFELPSGRHVQVIDLPGAYSLTATSPDEAITRDVCMGLRNDQDKPDMLVCVVDATNLRLHLRFALELRQLGLPMLLALNMTDAAARRNIRIDTARLSEGLGMPVVNTVAIHHDGAQALVASLNDVAPAVPTPLPEGTDLHGLVRQVLTDAVTLPIDAPSLDERIDRWALHPVWGMLILAVAMLLMFQAVYAWAAPMQDAIEAGMGWLGEVVGNYMPDGPLRGLLVDGVIAGAGGVLVFLPQILLLFLFILALEESGYLPRAAVLLDRFMVAAGLSGRAFIPMLSSFACAVPGIMATRSIQDPRDRLITILVAPLMTCSARLPVYALLIGAFIPSRQVWGVFNLQGLVLFALYAAGIVSALIVAYVSKLFIKATNESALLLELPSYRLPRIRNIAIGLWERAQIFLRRVGGIILALSVLLWFISTYPTPPADWTAPAIDYSFAGRIGHALAVVFEPIGFTWQICVALIPGLAAREVAVSGLATVYAVAGGEEGGQLGGMLASQWGLPTALSLLAWYVFAPQCISTLAIIKRETNGWKMVAVSAFYLTALAYGAAWITYRLALLLA